MDNLNQQLAQAQHLRENQQFHDAAILYQAILEQHPNQLQASMGLGLVYRQLGQSDKALEYFQKAVALNPNGLWPQIAISEELRDKRDFAAALAILNTFATKYPNHFAVVLRKGLIYRIQGDLQQALIHFQQAVAIDPNHLPSNTALSECLRDMGDLEQAVAILNKLEAQYPNNFEIVLRKGQMYCVQGNHQQALLCFQHAFHLNPNNIGVTISLINELCWHGDVKQAQELLNASLATAPTNINLLRNSVRIYREWEQREEALIQVQQALTLYPNDFQLHLEFAIVLRSLNRLDQSLAEFDLLQNNYPPNCNVLFHLAHVYREQGKHKLALTCLQQAVALNPNHLGSQIALAEELRNQGNFASALAILDQLEIKPANNSQVLMQKGHFYRAQNHSQQALVCYQQAYAIDNSNSNALIEIANEQFKLGRINAAINLLAQVLAKQPSDLRTLIQMGNWLNVANAKEQALNYFQQALAAHPKRIQPYIHTAQLLYDLGRKQDAFTLFQQAIEQCGESVEIYFHQAQMLWMSRELDAAWQCLAHGLKLFPDNYSLQIRRIEFLLQLGQFEQVQTLIESCPAENLDKKLQLQFFSAQLAERQWQIDIAIAIHQEILQQREHFLAAHDTLRRLYLLKLDIASSKHHALLTARYRLGEQKINGQTNRGHLHDHVAQMTDEYLLRPVLSQVQQALLLSPMERLNTLATLVQKDPMANSAANTFLIELRQQQHFACNHFAFGHSQIPKHIFQYWDKLVPPAEVVTFTQSWIQYNPDYLYQLFNKPTACDFLHAHYEAKVLRAYLRAIHPAQQADLLRLALLYEYGGVYADADDVCLKALAQWLPDTNILFYQEEYGTVGNNFIACIAKHPIIKQALDYAVTNLLRGDKDSIWLSTGPAMVSRALALYLAQNWSQASPKELGVVVMTREEIMPAVGIHGQLPYKATGDSWLIKEFKSGKKWDLTQIIGTDFN